MKKAIKKLFQFLIENLPAHKRVYFVYTHRNGFDRFSRGLKANTELSFWPYQALYQACGRVKFLKFQEENPSRIKAIRPQDIVIGHVGPTLKEAFKLTKKVITFCPWVGHEDHSKEAFNCCPKEIEMAYYDQAASVILLTSEFNKRHYLETSTNFWYPYFQDLKQKKRVRVVHQPIDLKAFPRMKLDYRTNQFLYVGNKGHMKGLEDAIQLVQQVGSTLHLYGLDKRLDNRDAGQVNRLAQQADFFIQPGMWEAQCVSILEAAARGFIPVVSPETGYPYDHPFLLRYGDPTYNLKVLKQLLKTSPEERKKLGDCLYTQLITDPHHNEWKKLTDVLVEEVKALL